MKKILFAIVIAATCIASCGKKTEQKPKAVEHPVDTGVVSVAVMPTLASLPLYVAYERGLFTKHGLNIKLCPFDAQMDVDTALLGGSVKGAVSDVFRTERLKNRKMDLVYLTSTEATWSLISNRAARLNKLEQFGDKMIATTRYSVTDYLTDETFREVKTSNPYFKIQINDVNVRLHMILNNEMDAAWFEEPLATMAENDGHKRLATPANKAKYGVIAFNGKYLKKRLPKEYVETFRKVYSESCDSLNKYGLLNYASEINKYCRVDTSVVNKIPKMVFTHAEKPLDEIIETAKKAAQKK